MPDLKLSFLGLSNEVLPEISTQALSLVVILSLSHGWVSKLARVGLTNVVSIHKSIWWYLDNDHHYYYGHHHLSADCKRKPYHNSCFLRFLMQQEFRYLTSISMPWIASKVQCFHVVLGILALELINVFWATRISTFG